MRWVVDASSVVAYLLGQGLEAETSAMLGDVHAPSLIDVEVTQTLRSLVRGTKVELAIGERAREELAQLGVRRHPDGSLLSRAWQLRDVCTTYDALYVGLAEGLEATLLTRDARLASGVENLIAVVLCG